VRILPQLFAAFALGSVASSAYGQGLPPGSYQQSCRDFRIQGATLTAVCHRAHGRGEQLTALNIAHCVGDIGNSNGQLICNGGRPAAPLPPRQGPGAEYPGPGYSPGPGYPGPGYAPPPRYSEDRSYWERCERLRHEEHELRDRLAYTPYGGEREQLQYRLGRVEAERRQCRRH
jgi:CVNH domain-containing protein